MIKDGDVLMTLRADGINSMIIYGTGSRVGHTCMTLWFDDELYVLESVDGIADMHGVNRTRWDEWIKVNADIHKSVVHLPLRPDLSAKFNSTKAKEFFNRTVGLPYGYHNFLFGAVDTEKDNLPPMMPNELVPIVFSVFETHNKS